MTTMFRRHGMRAIMGRPEAGDKPSVVFVSDRYGKGIDGPMFYSVPYMTLT